eukprot:29778-Pelagococcus_subviridis.AAC.4
MLTTSSAARNISYAITPTACERFKLVGPVPPVYLSDFRHRDPCPAVGIATAACAVPSSSFVSPVRSFPNSTATLPRFASAARSFAAFRAVTRGTFSRGRAVVACLGRGETHRGGALVERRRVGRASVETDRGVGGEKRNARAREKVLKE